MTEAEPARTPVQTSNRIRMRDIDFLIIGAAKSATTWLQQVLQSDPSVYMPDPELHYFSRNFHRGDDWYLRQFERSNSSQLVGEKSNSYLNTPGVAELVHKSLPHVKLVAQLRNPVDRAYSDYCMLYRRGEVSAAIENYLDPRIAADGRFLSSGNYSGQLDEYIKLFGRDQILLLTYERVRIDPVRQLNELRIFLGLQNTGIQTSFHVGKVKDKTVPMISPELKRYVRWLKPVVSSFRTTPVFKFLHSSLVREVKYPPLTPELRLRLRDFYAPENSAMEKLIGRQISEWK